MLYIFRNYKENLVDLFELPAGTEYQAYVVSSLLNSKLLLMRMTAWENFPYIFESCKMHFIIETLVYKDIFFPFLKFRMLERLVIGE